MDFLSAFKADIRLYLNRCKFYVLQNFIEIRPVVVYKVQKESKSWLRKQFKVQKHDGIILVMIPVVIGLQTEKAFRFDV